MTSAAGQTALFPHLSPADIDSLCVHGTEQTLTTGERLFSQDEPATNLFIILERVKVVPDLRLCYDRRRHEQETSLTRS